MSTLNIKWKRNEFNVYYAKQNINVGGEKSIKINKGEEFEYDGTILKYAGAEIQSSSFRGTFTAGWVSESPVDQDDEVNIPSFKPVRNIAKSQSVNSDLANVQRGGSRTMDSDDSDENVVLNVSDRENARNSAKGHLTSDDNRMSARNLRVKSDPVDDQGAVVIGKVRTSTHLVANVADNKASALKDSLENLSGSGYLRDDRSRKNIIQREGVTIKTNIGNVDRNSRVSSEADGTVVGQVRKSQSGRETEGITVQDTSGIRNKPAVKVAAPINTKINPRIRIARSIDPNFPADWSFEGKLQDRLAAIKDHGVTPEFLEAVYAAEGDQMRKCMVKAFPKQFS